MMFENIPHSVSPAWTTTPEPDHLTAEGWGSLEAGWLAEARFSTRDLRASTPHALAELQAARAAILEAVRDPVTIRGLEKLEAAPPLARMQGAARLATPGIAALASYATDPALADFLRALAEQARALATPPEPAPTEVKIGVI